MNEFDYHDVRIIGPKYTWCNNKCGNAQIWERLYRCLLNSKALELVPQVANRHVAQVASDHYPVVFQIFTKEFQKSKMLRFEDLWLSYHASFNVVNKAWSKLVEGDPMEVLNKKFHKMLRALFFWSRDKHQNLLELKEKLKKEVADLQNVEMNGEVSADETHLLLKIKVHDLNVTLARLNMWWRQRVKVKWLEEGDTNSTFFHAFANDRRNGNFIKQVKNEVGELVTDQDAIEETFLIFFFLKSGRKGAVCFLDGRRQYIP
ncbi:hypothetical protein KFK09_001679 [Dendrobium nobile]|uniref:Reverse transcriptase n=1 Tax=Dendrobium nobile TaxID=94219 RepID=A0A8T3CBK2_DENNO|nr:hypothetical protein KFK09_001679 [Dendrobium nobile]